MPQTKEVNQAILASLRCDPPLRSPYVGIFPRERGGSISGLGSGTGVGPRPGDGGLPPGGSGFPSTPTPTILDNQGSVELVVVNLQGEAGNTVSGAVSVALPGPALIEHAFARADEFTANQALHYWFRCDISQNDTLQALTAEADNFPQDHVPDDDTLIYASTNADEHNSGFGIQRGDGWMRTGMNLQANTPILNNPMRKLVTFPTWFVKVYYQNDTAAVRGVHLVLSVRFLTFADGTSLVDTSPNPVTPDEPTGGGPILPDPDESLPPPETPAEPEPALPVTTYTVMWGPSRVAARVQDLDRALELARFHVSLGPFGQELSSSVIVFVEQTGEIVFSERVRR